MHTPSEELATVMVHRLQPSLDAPAELREAIRRGLASGVGDQTLDEVLIVASELLSSGPFRLEAGAGTIAFRLRLGREVRVELDQPRIRPQTFDAAGLRLVSALAPRWGIVEDADSVAWAEIPLF